MAQLPTKELRHPACLFLPETGFYPYIRGLSVMGAALQNAGRPVLITRCTGQMPHCSMMVGHKVPLAETARAKKSMCAQCEENLSAALKFYGFASIAFADLHTDKIQSLLDDIATMSSEDLLHVHWGDSPAARLAQYDFGLEAKVAFSPKNTPEWAALFRAHVANTVLAGYYAESIAQTHHPAYFLTFNQYSQCNMVRFVARKFRAHFKSLTYATHFNADCSQFWIYDEGFHCMLHKHVAQWPKWRELPISAMKAFECWQDVVFRNRGQGSHIYSPMKSGRLEELFDSLALSRDRKLIVAFTSSNDEAVGSQGIAEFWDETLRMEKAFPDQIAWLRDLCNWALTRDDVQVVVRIHPREGKGKNYNHESSHLEQLRRALPQNSGNFHVIWPAEPISSYDLLEMAHACIIPWTSMGGEASRIGVPVLSWVGGMHYVDDDFIQVAPNYEKYRKRLNALPNFSPTWQTLTRAVRFYHWRTFATSLDLRDVVPIDCQDTSIWPMPPTGMGKDIVDILSGEQGLIKHNLEHWKRGLSLDATERELKANQKGILLYIDSIFCAQPEPPKKLSFGFRALRKALLLLSLPVPAFLAPPREEGFVPPTCVEYTLEFSEDISKLKRYTQDTIDNPARRYLIAEDAWCVWYIAGGAARRRLSPQLIRLGSMLRSLGDDSLV